MKYYLELDGRTVYDTIPLGSTNELLVKQTDGTYLVYDPKVDGPLMTAEEAMEKYPEWFV